MMKMKTETAGKGFRKLASVFVVFISLALFANVALAADVAVSRSMPDRVDPLGTLTVSFSITPAKTLTAFDLAELIPQTWSVKDWSVSGFDKSKITMDTQSTQSFMGGTYKGYHWTFNANLSSAATLTYTLDVPVSSGSYTFVGIWTYAGGFDKDEKTLTVATAPATTTLPPAVTTTAPAPAVTTTTLPGGGLQLGDYTIIIVVIVLIAAIVLVFWKFNLVKL
jgi:hypothetical protein